MISDPAFYEEEERCGFTVSADMKKIWAVEMDLLEQFIRVCRENGLRYYALGGTLLGAIRHKGYIPWDDDIDVVMFREDYDKLLKIGPTAFEAPYFFQSVDTDRRYSRGHVQLRNSNTTAILNCEKGCYSFNQGIFIDIFPLDNVPDDPEAFAAQRRKLYSAVRLLNLSARYPSNPHKSFIKNCVHLLLSLVPYRCFYRKLEKEAKRYNNQETRRVGLLTFLPLDDRGIYPRSGFHGVKAVPFETMEIDVPAGYDEILRAQYNDYMVMRRDNTYHGATLFDPDRSYIDYLK